jgi:hypothetical protein
MESTKENRSERRICQNCKKFRNKPKGYCKEHDRPQARKKEEECFER